MLLPMPDLSACKLPVQGDRRIVFYRGSGVRSEKVARVFTEAGMDTVAHMEGGLAA